MARVIADRVLETSTTTGTGAYTLAGAVTGFRAASAVCVNGDTFSYYAEEVSSIGVPNGGWETGLGTWGTGNVLTRTTIYASSNANAAVNWSAGTRRIAIGIVAYDAANYAPIASPTFTGVPVVPNGIKYTNSEATVFDNIAFKNNTSVPNGYIQLVTPIRTSDYQMFSIDIFGYDYNTGKSIDFTVVGYAYAATDQVINVGFSNRSSFSRQVRITLQDIGALGYRRMVITMGSDDGLGTSNEGWYYQKFAARVSGWAGSISTFQASDFTWLNATTQVAGFWQTANINNQTLDSQAGTLTQTGAISSGTVTAPRFVSSVASGTAPFTITSPTVVPNLNADMVDGLHPATANTASTIVSRDGSGNFAAGTITATAFAGNASSSSTSSKLYTADTRATNPAPETYSVGITSDFKSNATDSLSDGGTYHGVITLRQYASGSDWTGGGVRQLGFTDNHNMWIRGANADTTWSAWRKLVFSDSPTFTGTVTSPTFTSTQATGTAPFTVSSTTVVTNLNAHMVDGAHVGTSWTDVTGNTIPVRHASGYLYSNYFNCAADAQWDAPSHVAGQWSSDNYIRWQTWAQFKTNIFNVPTMVEPNVNGRINLTGQGVYMPASTTMAAASGSTGGMLVTAQGSAGTAGAAFISFHRSASYAAHFGIDTDNKWKVGGWSMGATSYEILHTGNMASLGAAASPTPSIISTNTTATAGSMYVLTASLTLTLPASPTAGNKVMLSNRSNTITAIIGRNGQNIMGLAQDMTIDDLNAGVTLVFADATRGWVIL